MKRNVLYVNHAVNHKTYLCQLLLLTAAGGLASPPQEAETTQNTRARTPPGVSVRTPSRRHCSPRAGCSVPTPPGAAGRRSVTCNGAPFPQSGPAGALPPRAPPYGTGQAALAERKPLPQPRRRPASGARWLAQDKTRNRPRTGRQPSGRVHRGAPRATCSSRVSSGPATRELRCVNGFAGGECCKAGNAVLSDPSRQTQRGQNEAIPVLLPGCAPHTADQISEGP